MNRSEKIQILSAIAAGKKTVKSLLPAHFKVYIWHYNRQLNTYTKDETGEVLSEDEFKILERNDKSNRINCVIIPPFEDDLSSGSDIIVHVTNVPVASSENEISEIQLNKIYNVGT